MSKSDGSVPTAAATPSLSIVEAQAQFHAQALVSAVQTMMKELKAERDKLELEKKVWADTEKKLKDTQVSNPVKLNIGGTYFSSSITSLRSQPGSYFDALLSERWEQQLSADGALFVDRDPTAFKHVLNYLRESEIDVYALTKEEAARLRKDADFYSLRRLAEILDLKILTPMTPGIIKPSASTANNKATISTKNMTTPVWASPSANTLCPTPVQQLFRFVCTFSSVSGHTTSGHVGKSAKNNSGNQNLLSTTSDWAIATPATSPLGTTCVQINITSLKPFGWIFIGLIDKMVPAASCARSCNDPGSYGWACGGQAYEAGRLGNMAKFGEGWAGKGNLFKEGDRVVLKIDRGNSMLSMRVARLGTETFTMAIPSQPLFVHVNFLYHNDEVMLVDVEPDLVF